MGVARGTARRGTQAATPVELTGDIDLANATSYGDLLIGIVDLTAEPLLVVDGSGVRLLGSHAMTMMQRVHRRGEARDVEVLWCSFAARHRHVLAIAGLDRALHLSDQPPPVGRAL